MKTEQKTEEVKKRKKVEVANTYLGLVSKVLTISAALSTLGIWAYSSYYVGAVEVRTTEPVESLTVKLYDDSGRESVYHTDHMKVVPGKYKVVLESREKVMASYPVDVKFNKLSVVAHSVANSRSRQAEIGSGQSEIGSRKAKIESTQTEIGYQLQDKQSGGDAVRDVKNRRWWQFWRRN